MHKKHSDENTAPTATLSRRRLLAGVAAGGGLLVAGAGSAAAPVTANTTDPQLQDALRRYGGEFGQLGSAKGGEHGHL